jgi:hypothetical protein
MTPLAGEVANILTNKAGQVLVSWDFRVTHLLSDAEQKQER